MVKRTIKFTDFNGVEKEKDYYFNLSKSELANMYFAQNDFASKLREIAQTKDIGKLMLLFKDIVLDAYGEKSEDGMRFIKRRNGVRIADEFVETPAFDELFYGFVQNPEGLADFVNSLLPPDMLAEVEKMKASGNIPEELKGLM